MCAHISIAQAGELLLRGLVSEDELRLAAVAYCWLTCAAQWQEHGYACGYATCTLKGNGPVLSPPPQARRASALKVAIMAKPGHSKRTKRQLVLRIRCSEEERDSWLFKVHAEERTLSLTVRAICCLANPCEVGRVYLKSIPRCWRRSGVLETTSIRFLAHSTLTARPVVHLT